MIILTAASVLPDAIDFFFQRQAIERCQRKREKKTDPPVENEERVAKSAVDFGGVSVNGGRVGNSPVRGHGLSRPQWTGFLGGIVANREDKMQVGSAGARKFIPTLTAQAGRRYASFLNLLQRFGTNRPRGMTPGAVGREGRLALVVEDRLGHDGTRR